MSRPGYDPFLFSHIKIIKFGPIATPNREEHDGGNTDKSALSLLGFSPILISVFFSLSFFFFSLLFFRFSWLFSALLSDLLVASNPHYSTRIAREITLHITQKKPKERDISSPHLQAQLSHTQTRKKKKACIRCLPVHPPIANYPILALPETNLWNAARHSEDVSLASEESASATEAGRARIA